MQGSDKQNKYIDISDDKLAINYSNGNIEAGGELISRYSGSLKSLATFIYHGTYKSSSIVFTLESIMNDKTVLNVIRQKIKHLEFEDVLQEIKVIFLELVKEFKPEKIKKEGIDNKFAYYYSSMFPFFIQSRYFSNYVNAPISVQHYDVEEILDEEKTQELEEEYFNNDIDTNWIKGKTCSEKFLNLNNKERKMLKKYYYSSRSVKEIAKKENKHLYSIYRNLRKIRNKIQK